MDPRQFPRAVTKSMGRDAQATTGIMKCHTYVMGVNGQVYGTWSGAERGKGSTLYMDAAAVGDGWMATAGAGHAYMDGVIMKPFSIS